MDTPSNGGRDSRFNLNSYEMPILSGDNGSEIGYNSNILHNRPTSITSSLSRSSSNLNSSCGPGLQRGMKRTSSDMCYDPNLSSRSTNMMGSDCSSDIMEDTYSPTNQKNSPLSNGKKTKGRVKIKMEYIDNKLRRYTTFSKRKTGIMKKAYELSTLTGTQVMLLVASETGHVYTFATRKLQPMITSEAGKALIQTCLNSPDPCPSGSGDQRMSATGFEETELSYNIGDDDKAETSSCSPYRSDSSDSSDVESISVSPSSSPPPLISLQDLQSTSTPASTAAAVAVINAVSNARAENRARNAGHDNQANQHIVLKNLKHEQAMANSSNGIAGSAIKNCAASTSSSSSSTSNVALPATINPSLLNGSTSAGGSMVFTLEQLQREFGLHFTNMADAPGAYITIPMLSGMTNAANSNPPAAHQTPADLSNRPRK